jgi:hypothetical protein
VVAERLCETPFTGAAALVVTECELICVCEDLSVWSYDFKQWSKIEIAFRSCRVLQFEDYLCMNYKTQSTAMLAFKKGKITYVEGDYVCT